MPTVHNHSFDADGCLFNGPFIAAYNAFLTSFFKKCQDNTDKSSEKMEILYQEFSEGVENILYEQNKALIDDIIAETPAGDIVLLSSSSNRMTPLIDGENSHKEKGHLTPLITTGLDLLQKIIEKKATEQKKSCTVSVDKSILEQSVAVGVDVSATPAIIAEATKNTFIAFFSQERDRITIEDVPFYFPSQYKSQLNAGLPEAAKAQYEPLEYMSDSTKLGIHLNKILSTTPPAHIVFYDDRVQLLTRTAEVLKYMPTLIPAGVTVDFIQYDNKNPTKTLQSITGTGTERLSQQQIQAGIHAGFGAITKTGDGAYENHWLRGFADTLPEDSALKTEINTANPAIPTPVPFVFGMPPSGNRAAAKLAAATKSAPAATKSAPAAPAAPAAPTPQ